MRTCDFCMESGKWGVHRRLAQRSSQCSVPDLHGTVETVPGRGVFKGLNSYSLYCVLGENRKKVSSYFQWHSSQTECCSCSWLLWDISGPNSVQGETLYGWRGADGSLPGHRGEPMWIPVGGWGVCSGCPERGAGAYRC